MSRNRTREMAEMAKDTAHQSSERAREAMRNVQETAGEWTHKVQHRLEPMAEAARGYVEQGREQAEQFGRTVSRQVHERPVGALLLATGVGFLLGLFLLRR